MGISAVDIIFTFAGNGSYSSFSEKEISKKVLPEMWNWDYYFGIGFVLIVDTYSNLDVKKEDLTEMIEDALDQEEIGEFDQLENSTDRMEEIEECMIERYIHNEKNI